MVSQHADSFSRDMLEFTRGLETGRQRERYQGGNTDNWGLGLRVGWELVSADTEG